MCEESDTKVTILIVIIIIIIERVNESCEETHVKIIILKNNNVKNHMWINESYINNNMKK